MPPSTPTEVPYSLRGVDFRKLLNRVASRRLTPKQAEHQLCAANQPSVRRFVAVSRGGVGILLLSAGLFLLYHSWQTNAGAQALDNRTRQTAGTVVELRRQDYRRQGPGYAPVFTYTVAGQCYQNTGGRVTRPASYSVGEPVTVRYHPTRPEMGDISTFAHRWLLVLMLGVPGLLWSLMGGAIGWTTLMHVIDWAAPPTGPLPGQLRRVFGQVAQGQLSVEAAERLFRPVPAAPTHLPAGRLLLAGLVGLLLITACWHSHFSRLLTDVARLSVHTPVTQK